MGVPQQAAMAAMASLPFHAPAGDCAANCRGDDTLREAARRAAGDGCNDADAPVPTAWRSCAADGCEARSAHGRAHASSTFAAVRGGGGGEPGADACSAKVYHGTCLSHSAVQHSVLRDDPACTRAGPRAGARGAVTCRLASAARSNAADGYRTRSVLA